MAKLTRQTLTLFGGSGATSNFAEFGSQAASAPVKTKDIPTIQSLSAWVNGWQSAVALGEAPYLEDMNGLLYVFAYEQVYQFQEGIPEYDSGTTYYIGSFVKKSGTDQIFVSLADNNTGQALPTAPASNGNWQFVMGTVSGNWAIGNNLVFPSGKGIVGITNAGDAAAGNVGEAVRGYASGVAAGTTNQYKDVTTISLTAGDWDVTGQVIMAGGATTFNGIVAGAISLFANNTVTDHVTGDNVMQGTEPDASSLITGVTIANYRINVNTTTTVHLKGLINYTAGSPTITGRISARRVR